MTKKRKLDTDEHNNKVKKKCKVTTSAPCPSNQKHMSQTMHNDLTGAIANSAYMKCAKKDNKVNTVNDASRNGDIETSLAAALSKTEDVSSASKRRNSCMKHTHQDKVKRKKNKHKTGKSAAVKLPEAPEEFSANWKNLLKTLTTTRKAEKKPLTGPHTNTTLSAVQQSKTTISTAAPDIWFDDVDDIFIEKPKLPEDEKESNKLNPLVLSNSFDGLTKAVAMDCEMVGVGSGGEDSILARVSIVNQFGQCIYDTFVKPTESVTDYRTHVSGVRQQDVAKAPTFETVQKKVSDILKSRILVGHALHNDLKVLFLDHPRKRIRDTARYKPYRSLFNGANPSLKKLTEKVLGVKVQEGEHSSVQDAQAAMRLYTYHKKQWEKEIASKFKKFKKTPKTAQKKNNGTAMTD